MANSFYYQGKVQIWSGGVNLLTDTLKLYAVDGADYTPNLTTHDFLNDVPAGARVSSVTVPTSGRAFSNPSGQKIAFDMPDVTLPSVTGDQFEYLLLVKDTGTESTSPLLVLWDTATGLAFTPVGTDIQVIWSDGDDKAFSWN